jgi:TetR/AcrR family transcriptional regulator, transcriptional repressor for nem operon
MPRILVREIGLMRYGPGHKERTRARILEAARRVFQREGYEATGVDRVMEEAGLTAGGFYAHFASKQALLVEALAHAAVRTGEIREGWVAGESGPSKAGAFIDHYLSDRHRRGAEEGCPLAALVSEASHSAGPVKESFEAAVREIDAWMAGCGAGEGLPEDRRLAVIALCVGGLSVARSVRDDALGDRILAACRRLAREGLGLEPGSDPGPEAPST